MKNKETVEVVEKKSILQKELSLKEILIVVGVFAVVIGYVCIFLLPRYNEYKDTVSKLKEIEQNITNYESEISTLTTLEKQLSTIEKEVEYEKKQLSHNMEDGMFLVGLSNLINGLDVDLLSYTMEDTISYGKFYAIPTTIEVRGNYNYIRRIMSYLEEQKNTTQILDYNMETYINDENDTQQVETQPSNETVTDSVVYWTNSGSMYHKQVCSILNLEQQNSGDAIQSGTVEDSHKSSPCETCKPYSTTSTEVDPVETTEPKATGDIVARFKFIMYSVEDPKYGLDIEDFNDWEPGKYNPFTSTTR